MFVGNDTDRDSHDDFDNNNENGGLLGGCKITDPLLQTQGCCWSHGQLPLSEDVADYAVYFIGDPISSPIPALSVISLYFTFPRSH